MTIEKIAGRINHGPAFFMALQMRSNLPKRQLIVLTGKMPDMIWLYEFQDL
jgi:hypothetical protein